MKSSIFTISGILFFLLVFTITSCNFVLLDSNTDAGKSSTIASDTNSSSVLSTGSSAANTSSTVSASTTSTGSSTAGTSTTSASSAGVSSSAASSIATSSSQMSVIDSFNSPKSFKRGIAYNITTVEDLAALAPGVSWWYNWGSPQSGGVPENTNAAYNMDYIPMLWNQSFTVSTIENFILSHPNIQYLLLMNEPNLTDQANRTPAQAAVDWIKYEQVADDLSNQGRIIYLVGPAMNWGTMANYGDPVLWLDAFYSNYQANNGGKNPHVDYLAFHWYDWGLDGMLHNLEKYGKKIWVTEMANWNSVTTSLQNEKDRMQEMVTICETNTNVFRYAWFTGRWSPDPHYTSLLSTTNGVLSALGQYYMTLPYTVTNN